MTVFCPPTHVNKTSDAATSKRRNLRRAPVVHKRLFFTALIVVCCELIDSLVFHLFSSFGFNRTMGKGGEKSADKATLATKSSGQKQWKLAHMETEVLRKWAKAYNVDKSIDTRDSLLEHLVSLDRKFPLRTTSLI